MSGESLADIRERLDRFSAGDSRGVTEPGALRDIVRIAAGDADIELDLEACLLAGRLCFLRWRACPRKVDLYAALAFLYPVCQESPDRLPAQLRRICDGLDFDAGPEPLTDKATRLAVIAEVALRDAVASHDAHLFTEARALAERVGEALPAEHPHRTVLLERVEEAMVEWENGADAPGQPHASWQEELVALDKALAAGRLPAAEYRVRRDQVLDTAASAGPVRVAPVTSPPPVEPPQWVSSPNPGHDPTQVVHQQPGYPDRDAGYPQQGYMGPPWSHTPPQSADAEHRPLPDVFEEKPRVLERVRRFFQRPRASAGRSSGTVDVAAPPRFLVADLPRRAPLSAEVSLVVRVCRDPSRWPGASASLSQLVVPPAGAQVSVLVQASAGLMARGPLEQVLTVPSDGDSTPVRFAFTAHEPGLHRVRVMAFVGGTFLAELELEVSVEPGGPSVDGEPTVVSLDQVQARQGEVTLQVRSEGHGTVFQLLSDTYLFEPVVAQASVGDPTSAVERTLSTLRQLAQGRSPYSGGTAQRWMREAGIGLWNDVVPALIKEQYWQLRDNITSFTIATSHDVIPWELLYPLRPGADNGFMVQQFPVLRRVFGQHRAQRLAVVPCTYVVSARAPGNARQEIASVARLLGDGRLVEELDELLDVIGSGDCGSLHFACHNAFSNDGGSSIGMTGGPFVPGLLNSAATQRTLAAKSPLVFLNACRSAGSIPEYTRMIGWAQQFMAAGAGAFVGTLWPVRSDSAGEFAEAFYAHLRDGEQLGRAALLARQPARDEPDPTWLAYTVYGDPYAHAYWT